MKRVSSIFLVLFLVFLLAACNSEVLPADAETSAPETTAVPAMDNIIKIGIIEPMTGDSNVGGNQELLGINFAHRNKSSVMIGDKKYKIQLEKIDDKSSYKNAKAAAEKLLSSGVCAVIGSYGSSQTAAIVQALSKTDVPVIGVNCTSVNLPSKNDSFFRMCQQDSNLSTKFAKFSKDYLSAKKAYVLSEIGNDDSQTAAYMFTQKFTASGGKAINETFEKGTENFKSLLKNAVKQKCDMIFVPIPPTYSENIISQAYELKFNAPILAPTSWDTHSALEAAWNYDAELYAASFVKENEENKFYYNIQEWINNDAKALKLNGGKLTISSATVLSYDAYNTLIAAIVAAKSIQSQDIKKAMANVNHNGVSGKISFNSSGNNKGVNLYMKKADIVNDIWKYVAI